MPDPPPDDADDIRLRMAGVRDALDGNVHEFVENAKNLTDWRYYVKAAPWGAVGAAAAIGYFIVPRRVQVVRPTDDQLAQLAERHPFVGTAAKAEAQQSGPAQVVMTMLANAMLRAATAYVSQKAGKVFGEQAAEKSQDQFNAEVPGP